MGSKTADAMRVVDAYINPILEQAVKKAKEDKQSGFSERGAAIEEDETLLGHLVRLTSGKISPRGIDLRTVVLIASQTRLFCMMRSLT